MDLLEVCSEDDANDPFKLPFVAPDPQPNSIKRLPLAQLELKHEEVNDRPNYWSITRKMEEFKELQSKVGSLN